MAKPGPDNVVQDIEILRQIKLSSDPVVTSGELADALGYTRSNVNYRLKRLRGKGLVDRKKAGSRAVVWWITEDGVDKLAEATQ